MDLLKEKLGKDEKIESIIKQSKNEHIKNYFLSNLIYIVIWLGLDAYFAYLMTLSTVNQNYWFIIIPMVGLNLLKIWTSMFAYLKATSEVKVSAYVLTNKALYFYQDGKYKTCNKILYKDVVSVKKSEYMLDGFYVASKDNFIKIINVENMEVLQKKITEMVVR